MTSRLTSTALAIAVGLSSAAAFAGQSPEIAVRASEPGFRKLVSYSDLDLTSATGSSILKHRVRVAAFDGCSDLYAPQPPMQTMSARSICVGDSVKAAASQIDRVLQLAALGKSSGTDIALVFRK